jgi:hypothetical protein
MMRRNLIGVLVVLVIAAAVLAFRIGGRHEVRATLDQMLATLPPGTTATHGATDYNPITDTLTIHDLVLNHDGRKFGSAGLVVAQSAHIEAIRAVFDPDAYPDGKPAWTDRRALLGHLDIQSLRIESGQPGSPPLLIRHATLDTVAGRPFIRPPTPPNRSAADFQADAARAVTFHLVTLEGIDLSRDGQGHFGVSSASLTDYDSGQLGDGRIEGVEISVPQGSRPVSFSLAKIAIGSVDLRSVVAALGASAGQDPAARGRAVAGAFSGAHGGRFDLDGMALKITPGPRIDLASFHSQSVLKADGAAVGSGALHGLSVAAEDSVMPPATRDMMQRFGADRVVLDEDGEGTSNPATRHFDLSRLDLALHDLCTLHLTASLDGIDREGLRATDIKVRGAAIMQIVIDHAALSFDDKSLVGRVIGVLAMQQNSTPEAVRAQAAMPLAALSMLLPDEPDAAAQITAFLDHPHNLRITLDPPTPVSLAQVAAAPMQSRAHMLGLKITGD